ncbi:site-specific integrase [Runella sp.]|uniref:site-specific integrase n=1 Tax=Runella sp. TaxID=1960881 RepID=UPI002603911C|nr:site-specific integrase [Runella sp.]
MTTTTTFSVLFWANQAKSRNGLAPIYARITVDGKRSEISLKRSISYEAWDNVKGRARGTKAEAKALNAYLDQVKSRLLECQETLLREKRLVTAEAIKNGYLGTGEREHTLLSLIKYHNEELSTTIKPGTLKNYFATHKYVERFLKEKLKTSDIFLSELNHKFVVDFELFIKNTAAPLDPLRRCGNNTVMKHIERLRKMINVAIRNEWITKDPFQRYRLSFNKTNRHFLTAEELTLIVEKAYPIQRLQQVKDLFVFSCYTGLAYTDLIHLTSENLVRGIDGQLWIESSRQKTDQAIKVPLLNQALEILNRYQDHPKAVVYGRLFPPISNQRMNSYLKEIADTCGISKNLTFHIARHTFATTVTLTNGVPIESVSAMLGHSTIRTTQIYAKVVESKLSGDMKALQKKLTPFQTNNADTGS